MKMGQARLSKRGAGIEVGLRREPEAAIAVEGEVIKK
jgi:hypothetical protein